MNDLNDLFEQMKEDPESVTVVGTSAPGSMDHMQFVRIAKAAGVIQLRSNMFQPKMVEH